jgi:hypothetical protein
MYEEDTRYTLSHHLSFQISVLHEKTKRRKAKTKAKEIKYNPLINKNPQILFTTQGISTGPPLNNIRKPSAQSLHRNSNSKSS